MNNSEIELELMQRFGLEKTIAFAEMASVMYSLLYDDFMKRKLDDICDYEYDRDWWKNKHEELKSRKTIKLT